MARPTDLTPETQRRICEALDRGATYELAAQYGGIHYDTFNRWMKKGGREKEGEFYEFYEAVKKAEASAAIKWLAVIDKAALIKEEWQAAAWKLERRYPQQYGRQVRELTGKDDGPVVVKVVYDKRTHSEAPETA